MLLDHAHGSLESLAAECSGCQVIHDGVRVVFTNHAPTLLLHTQRR